MRAKIAFALALAVAIPLGSASAQPAAQTVAPSPERIRLARAVFEAQGGLGNLTAAVNRMMDGMMANMPAGSDGARAAQQSAKEVMTEMLPQILDAQTEAFAETFDEKQLGDILAFYKTPTGQYLRDHLPDITARTGAAMAKMLPTMTVKILERTCARTTCTAAQQSQLAALKQRLAASPAP